MNKDVTCYAAAALHNLIDNAPKNKMCIRAAGAIPRFLQLVELGPEYAIVEVAVRTLFKMCEKCEEIQMDIRNSSGIEKLIELKSKSKTKIISLSHFFI